MLIDDRYHHRRIPAHPFKTSAKGDHTTGMATGQNRMVERIAISEWSLPGANISTLLLASDTSGSFGLNESRVALKSVFSTQT